MELWQLRTFRIIAETLNFTKASEKLHLTQSAVSHQIKALEEELGEPLFIRAKRGVVLTEAGKIALDYAIRILDEAEVLKEKVAGRKETLTGRVRVAAATQAFVFLFAPLFQDFMNANKNIEVAFRTTVSTNQTVEDILNGVADIGFASLPVYSPNLKVVDLFEDELVLVVGKNHEWAKQKEVLVEELGKERWILFERGASIRRATDEFFKKVGVEPELSLESNDTYFIKQLIENGLGISLLPIWAVRKDIDKNRLAIVRISGHKLKRSVAMVSLKGFQSAPIRAFIEHIINQKEKLQALALDENLETK